MGWNGIRKIFMALAIGCVALSGCGDDDDGHDHHPEHDGGMRRTSADVEPLHVGRQIEGVEGRVTVELLDFHPAEPELDDNEWRIRLMRDGAPYAPSRILVEPWMPGHNHGTTFPPMWAARDEPGEYVIERMSFTMGGYWEITVFACEDDTSTESQRCDRENPDALIDRVVIETWVFD